MDGVLACAGGAFLATFVEIHAPGHCRAAPHSYEAAPQHADESSRDNNHIDRAMECTVTCKFDCKQMGRDPNPSDHHKSHDFRFAPWRHDTGGNL